MTIKIAKGEIVFKKALSRREKYEMDNKESEAITLDPLKETATVDPVKTNETKEYKVLLAIEKIVIDGEEKPVNMKTLFNEEWLTDEDFKEVFSKGLEHANKLAFKAVPSKKS